MQETNTGRGPLPERWLYCPRKSDSLIADKFLAFKTPLCDRFSSKMPEECLFTPKMLLQIMKSYKVKLGLWIDLTNTNRFYDRSEVETNDCKYIKLTCRGHGETPSPEQTRSFIEIVDDFIRDHPLETIGVHCTHGFNRTGFLIVSYMVEKMDCSVVAALYAFQQARPPGIYKSDYIKELLNRYGDEDETFTAPIKPDWSNDMCFQDETEEHSTSETIATKRKAFDGEAGQNSCDNTNDFHKRKRRKEFMNINATFMAGVPGVELFITQPRLSDLQNQVQQMCDWTKNGFPGSQPVSMDRSNIKLLQIKPYMVSWKADGTRYMMFIEKENEIYFFDRDFSCFKVSNLRFPSKNEPDKHIMCTLLDGEMVIDKVNGLSIPRYLVYDIIKFNNEEIGSRSFIDRLKCIDKEIIAPRHEAMKRGAINKQKEPFSVRKKDFWEVSAASSLLGEKFAKSLSHEPDGLIFQPKMDPYTPGQCPEVLKWKPPELNSVDFKLLIKEESGIGLLTKKVGFLYVGGLEAPFAQIKVTKDIKHLHNKIIECKLENNSWKFMRERTDKSYPNSFNTAKAVCESIVHPVTKQFLLEFIAHNRFLDDTEAMPPPRR
ncbi:mRNA-capping enzyme-like [Culicoides brevitarsis]|uniref:mRNA-capping enzyme-like n=1 Tax=Culicoides brevitarsis TaxID=469753 RepID=UPI00307B3910